MSTLPDITDVRPVGPADRACLTELRAVLARHAALDRFGITLLHDHFPMGDDEQLMETCDPATRTLTIRPEALDEIDHRSGSVIETMWHFDPVSEDALAGLVCKVGCFVDLQDRHRRTHNQVRG
jgi:hypothetical protein